MSLYSDYVHERGVDRILEEENGFLVYNIIGKEVYIKDLFVSKEHRKSGLAKSMVYKVLDIAKSLGCMVATTTVVPYGNNATDSIKVLLTFGMKLHRSDKDILVFIKEI